MAQTKTEPKLNRALPRMLQKKETADKKCIKNSKNLLYNSYNRSNQQSPVCDSFLRLHWLQMRTTIDIQWCTDDGMDEQEVGDIAFRNQSWCQLWTQHIHGQSTENNYINQLANLQFSAIKFHSMRRKTKSSPILSTTRVWHELKNGNGRAMWNAGDLQLTDTQNMFARKKIFTRSWPNYAMVHNSIGYYVLWMVADRVAGTKCI